MRRRKPHSPAPISSLAAAHDGLCVERRPGLWWVFSSGRWRAVDSHAGTCSCAHTDYRLHALGCEHRVLIDRHIGRLRIAAGRAMANIAKDLFRE